jgi:superfamily II DNA helicase RecQ
MNSGLFRPKMQLIGGLMGAKVPLTFLTATLPPRLEPQFKRLLNLPDKYTMIRTATNRPEHQYILFQTTLAKLRGQAIAFIRGASSFLSAGQRAIVFVRSKLDGEFIRSSFPRMSFIHSEVKDEDTRSKMMSDWETGCSGGWIMGTTSLIQGVDYPDVRLVVFVGSPFGMIDLVQGAGRAGRNGHNAIIVVLHSVETRPHFNDDADLSCATEMDQWLKNETKCRRVGISGCMDGAVVTCASLPQAVPCDICKPDQEVVLTWDNAKDLHTTVEASQTQPNLMAHAPTTSPVDPTRQIPVTSLKSRPPPPSVLQKANKEIFLSGKRIEKARMCIKLLKKFSPNCGICHAESGGQVLSKIRHTDWTKCRASKQVFAPFYDWNKPDTKTVRRQAFRVLCRH